MKLIDKLEAIQTKRKYPHWRPRKVEATVSNVDPVIIRCLEFLPLELSVAEWDYEASNLEDCELIADILHRNANDEDKHDKALAYLSKHYGMQPGVRSQEAQNLIDRWKNNKSHPLCRMLALEMGVFFSILPYLKMNGDTYAAEVSDWIKDDEVVHVKTGLLLVSELWLTIDKELLKLVYDSNNYIFKSHDKAAKATMRLVNGSASDLIDESLPQTVGFFELNDVRKTYY
jgi:hypothetical protein